MHWDHIILCLHYIIIVILFYMMISLAQDIGMALPQFQINCLALLSIMEKADKEVEGGEGWRIMYLADVHICQPV